MVFDSNELELSGLRDKFLNESLSLISRMPLSKQFMFASEFRKPFDLSDLQSPKTWANLADRVKAVRRDAVNGDQSVIVTIERTPGQTFEVALSEKHEYYPMQVTTSSKFGSETSKVVRFKEFSLGEKMILIPTEIQSRYMESHGLAVPTLTDDVVANETSIKFNEPIKKEFFSLPLSGAAYIYDKDRGIYLKRNDRTCEDK